MSARLVRRLLLLTCAVCCCPALSAAADDCDCACLKRTLDQYLNAVIKHEPSAAPLFVAFRQTENALVVRWAPACGRR